MTRSAFNLSRASFLADFVQVPLALCVLATLVAWSLVSAGLILLGVVAWTLVEYCVHRWLLHRGPLLRYHAAHHREPQHRIGVSSLWTALVLGAFTYACFEFPPAAPLVAGLLTGYLWYLATHYVDHHWRGFARPGGHLQRVMGAHDVHHGNYHVFFGVTTTAWDRVFGTVRP